MLEQLVQAEGLDRALAFVRGCKPSDRTEALYTAAIDACIKNLARREALEMQAIN